MANVNLNLAKAVPKPEESDGGLNSSSKRHNEPQESTLDAALKMLKTQVQAAESSAQEANDDVDSVKDVSELVEEAMGTSRSVEDKTETENQMEVDEPMESDDEEGELHVVSTDTLSSEEDKFNPIRDTPHSWANEMQLYFH